MQQNDTVYLLKECDSGTKMATSSIDEVIDKVKDCHMKDLLMESREHHSNLGNEIHSQLIEHGSQEKDPNPIAKGMSWMKTNIKLGMDASDSAIADVLIDGCNMGVKSLHKYLNQYQAADDTSRELCQRLIGMEEQLGEDLRCYL